jgi:hypothetical protein
MEIILGHQRFKNGCHGGTAEQGLFAFYLGAVNFK